jgi:hypothetical protein
MSPQPDTLESRLKRIEDMLAVILAKAEQHPVGRKVLAYLGLK